MIPIVAKHGGYRRTLTFGYVCLVYHATEVFCERNFSYRNDPPGKTVGQMIGAAPVPPGSPVIQCKKGLARQ